jgi:hypothetical protein
MRALVLALAALSALCASGCLRTKFDLCATDPPDPQCAYLDAGADAPGDDAGSDAAVDAATSD